MSTPLRIVILGGSSGIGFATAHAAAQAGHDVIIASSSRARVDAALAKLPAGATGHTVDLRDERAIAALFETIGVFDHLVFTAGENLLIGALKDLAISDARAFFEIRYWGAVMAAKYAAPKLRHGGSIVFTGGGAAHRPHSGWSIGASVLSGLEGLTRALAIELAPIRVNLICPGFVETELWAGVPDADRAAMFAAAAKVLPVRHVAKPDELARAYMFAIECTFATGQTYIVDGGHLLV